MLGPYWLDSIVTGDARELVKALPDQSVDLIFTDPPYLKKYMTLYDLLAAEAPRVLKPDGFLLVYAGTYWKAEVMQRLSTMEYYFDFILINSGNSPIMWVRKVISRHKSILAYRPQGSSGHPRTNVLSLWNGSGEDKRYHTWGQDESSARYYIDCFSQPGDLVLDLFCGGGTTPAVCKTIGRKYLAFELDPETAEVARDRVARTFLPLFPITQQIEGLP